MAAEDWSTNRWLCTRCGGHTYTEHYRDKDRPLTCVDCDALDTYKKCPPEENTGCGKAKETHPVNYPHGIPVFTENRHNA